MASRNNFTLVLSFIIAIGPISVDMCLPAFGAIAQDFQDKSVPQLTLAWYSVGFALGQMTFGPLSDWTGRLPALISGLGLYVTASIGCGLATEALSLCAFRALAAFGGAAPVVVTRAMVFDMESGDAAARRLSSVFSWMMIAPLVAPLLGSLTLRVLGWRAIFDVAAGYGTIGLILLLRFLPETLPASDRSPIVLRSLTPRYMGILRERDFLTNALIGSFSMAALFIYLGGSPGLFMNQYDFSPTAYSWTLAAVATATIAMLRFNRWLIGRAGWGFARAANFALGLFLSGSALLLPLVWFSSSWPLVLLILLVCAAGFTCIQPNVQPAALRAHQAHKGTAQSLMSTMQYGAGAVGTAFLGLWADGTGRPMALLMVICALGALLAASLRPRVGKLVS